MKYLPLIVLTFTALVTSAYSEPDDGITKWDQLEKKWSALKEQNGINSESQEMFMRMVKVASDEFSAPAKRKKMANSGLSPDWLSRLNSLSKYEWPRGEEDLRDPKFLKLLYTLEAGQVETDEDPSDIMYMMRRCELSQILAAHYYMKTNDYETALSHLKTASEYLNAVRHGLPELAKKAKGTFDDMDRRTNVLKSRIQDAIKSDSLRSAKSRDSDGVSSTPRQSSESGSGVSAEVQRFQQKFKDTTSSFVLVSANITVTADVTLILKHSESGKKFSITYDKSFAKGLAGDNKLQPGALIEVRFDNKGEPSSAKNPSNGFVVLVSNYKVTGYGW